MKRKTTQLLLKVLSRVRVVARLEGDCLLPFHSVKVRGQGPVHTTTSRRLRDPNEQSISSDVSNLFLQLEIQEQQNRSYSLSTPM